MQSLCPCATVLVMLYAEAVYFFFLANSRSLKPHLESLIGTLSVDPSKEKSK